MKNLEELRRALSIEIEIAEEDNISISSAVEEFSFIVDVVLSEVEQLENLIKYLEIIKESIVNPIAEQSTDTNGEKNDTV